MSLFKFTLSLQDNFLIEKMKPPLFSVNTSVNTDILNIIIVVIIIIYLPLCV